MEIFTTADHAYRTLLIVNLKAVMQSVADETSLVVAFMV